jgi:hypothetical protein
VSFIRDFAVTTAKTGYKKIGYFQARQFLYSLTPEELLQIFFSIVVFNHDIVKKKTLEILSTLGIPRGASTNLRSSRSTANTTRVFQFPKYSDEPFSREILNQLDEQSRLN